jgi:signal transduction histidine kinase
LAALEQDAGLRPDVREDLAMMKRNIELETKLTNELLDLSRITSGKVELEVETVDLNEIVRHACGSCRFQMCQRLDSLRARRSGSRLHIHCRAAGASGGVAGKTTRFALISVN